MDPADDGRGGDWGEARWGFREEGVGGSDLCAEVAFELTVFIVVGDGEDVGTEAEEVLAEVEPFFVTIADDDGIDDAESFEESFFVFVGDGGFAAFMDP